MGIREETTYLHEEKQSPMIPGTWGAQKQVELNGL